MNVENESGVVKGRKRKRQDAKRNNKDIGLHESPPINVKTTEALSPIKKSAEKPETRSKHLMKPACRQDYDDNDRADPSSADSQLLRLCDRYSPKTCPMHIVRCK